MTVTPTTTIRVSRNVRDRLMRTRERDFDDAPTDVVISALLDDHDELMTRARARADAERIGTDPADRAEIDTINREWADVGAW